MPKTPAAPASERPRTSAEIAAEIAATTTTRSEAEAEIGRLAAARPGLLLDMSAGADAAIDKHDIAAGRAARRLERATAMLAQLGTELDAARHAEREAVAREAYSAGERAAAEYRRLAEREYPAAARKVASILDAMRTALGPVQAANAMLPAGTGPIDADAFWRPTPPPIVPPPAEIEDLVWVDRNGRPCRPILTPKGGRMVPDIEGARQEPRMVPNPHFQFWSAPVRPETPGLLQLVKLPAVTLNGASFWPEARR